MTEPLQLFNPEAEQALLGCLLLDNSLLHRVDFLVAPDFFEPLHQRIYDAIGRCVVSGSKADPITLKPEFDKDETLADIGGGAYLSRLAAVVIGFTNPKSYAREVKRFSMLRQIEESIRTAEAALAEGNPNPEEIAAGLSAAMISLTDNSCGNAARSDQEITLEIIEGLKGDDRPFSTGIAKLDQAMDGGMYPGKAYGMCARKKVGKTIMAGTISYNLEKTGVKHLFICAEMGPVEIHQRFLSREVGCYPSAFRTDYRNRPEFQESLVEASKRYKRNLIYQNAPGLTLDQLKLYVSRGVNNYKIKGFILDYWQLVQGKGKGQSDASHLDTVAQWIAQVCKEHNIWALVTAQINQEGNTRGGEGIRLAFDQVYTLQCPGDDVTRSDRWLEMNDTRYTAWNNVGSESSPALLLEQQGMYFEEIGLAA